MCTAKPSPALGLVAWRRWMHNVFLNKNKEGTPSERWKPSYN
jgi:hypothetical protein